MAFGRTSDAKSVTREVEEPVTSTAATAPGDHPTQGDDDVPALLDQLSGKQDKLLMVVSGHRIGLTNLNKVLWPGPDAGGPYTKRDLLRHYLEVSPLVLPHLRDRPLTFTRYPNGIHEGSFYQKHSDLKRPEFVDTVRLFSSHNEGDGDFIMANNLPTLIWLAQLASIELHPWLSRVVQLPDATHLPAAFTGSKAAIDASVLNYPDFIVFDLDPYIYSGEEKSGAEPDLNRRAFSKTVEVAPGAQGHPRPALSVILHQDIGEDRTPRLRAYTAPVRLPRDPQHVRAHRPFPHAASAEGRYHGVDDRQALREDIPGPQPERPHQEHGLDLLPETRAPMRRCPPPCGGTS